MTKRSKSASARRNRKSPATKESTQKNSSVRPHSKKMEKAIKILDQVGLPDGWS